MAKLNINETNYYYEEAGNGEPLLLIAGLSCDISLWASIYADLTQSFRVIIFDNRDVGRTDYINTNYTIEDMADDTVGLIQTLGYGKVSILGHSMGGAIAQNIAFRYPQLIDRLIIANSLVKPSAVSKMALEFTANLYNTGISFGSALKSLAPWLYSADFLGKNDNLEMLIELVDSYPYIQRPDGNLRQMFATCNFDSTSYLNKIMHKTLIIAGENDLLAPVDQSKIMASNIPNSKLIILPGSHMPIIEIPKIFTKTVLDFLKK